MVHASHSYQIKEKSSKKENERRVHASFASILNLSEMKYFRKSFLYIFQYIHIMFRNSQNK